MFMNAMNSTPFAESFRWRFNSVAGTAALTPLHSHKFTNWSLLPGGRHFRDEKQSYHIKAGDFWGVRPDIAHEYCRQNHLASPIPVNEDELKFQMYDLTSMPGWNSTLRMNR